MSHVLVVFDAQEQAVDFATDANGHISLAAGLETMSLYSLGSNRRFELEGGGDPQGWWGDDYPEVEGDQFGSLIWLYGGRGKLTPQELRKMQLAGEESFQWMIQDGLADTVTFEVERSDPDRGGLVVRITRPDGSPYSSVWQVHENGV